jgi:hypothetical protein
LREPRRAVVDLRAVLRFAAPDFAGALRVAVPLVLAAVEVFFFAVLRRVVDRLAAGFAVVARGELEVELRAELAPRVPDELLSSIGHLPDMIR